jgi:hypothetical protein
LPEFRRPLFPMRVVVMVPPSFLCWLGWISDALQRRFRFDDDRSGVLSCGSRVSVARVLFGFLVHTSFGGEYDGFEMELMGGVVVVTDLGWSGGGCDRSELGAVVEVACRQWVVGFVWVLRSRCWFSRVLQRFVVFNRFCSSGVIVVPVLFRHLQW